MAIYYQFQDGVEFEVIIKILNHQIEQFTMDRHHYVIMLITIDKRYFVQ